MHKDTLSTLTVLVRRAAVISLFVSVPVYIFLAILFHEFRLSYQLWSVFFLQLTVGSWLLVLTALLALRLALSMGAQLRYEPER